MFADKVLSSQSVFTGLDDVAKPGAIAIKDNKIIATGSLEEIQSFIGPNTKEYDFGDQTIMSGFHDSHIHLMLGALLTHGSVDLSSTSSSREALEKIMLFANENEEKDWIIGFGWDHLSWGEEFPDRSMLDRVIGERPVFLFHAEFHYTWVNSKALEITGITSRTKNPPNGEIQKNEKGDPTGILIETATSLVADTALTMSEKEQEELLELFLKDAAKLGITSVNDLYINSFEQMHGETLFNLFKKFDERNRLSTRIHLYSVLDDNLEEAKRLRKKFNTGKLKHTGLKQFIDGVVTSHTAYMLDPYTDKNDTKGSTALPKDVIKKYTLEADKEGFQIRFHAIGDGAINFSLDIFEEAKRINGDRDSRHALEHIEVIDPKDIARLKRLGVVPSIQPSHLALMPIESHTDRVGKEKHPYIYPCKSLQGEEIKLSFGTDFPVTILDPMLEIYYAVTRKDYTGEYVWNPEEKISLSEALKAYTSGSAYSVFREDELGTLEKGKLADIIVLDKNIFQANPENIPNTKVILTMVDGDIIFMANEVDRSITTG
ncbi:amidohydrolase [Oceanobacillus sp. AG]|uniref:amidohydrolase n=1 Tax=Oceanobacillus sp. AG TaxID=2681969 RepID=UPI0012EC6F9E|nr:amidohydrolase [Oceanobacillus sp. AG]